MQAQVRCKLSGEGLFGPKLSELPPLGRTGWWTRSLRPIDRARRGTTLGQMIISVHILMNSLISQRAARFCARFLRGSLLGLQCAATLPRCMNYSGLDFNFGRFPFDLSTHP